LLAQIPVIDRLQI